MCIRDSRQAGHGWLARSATGRHARGGQGFEAAEEAGGSGSFCYMRPRRRLEVASQTHRRDQAMQ
eukprot:9181354-Pyramimonas_sp.AAC.1